MRGRIGVKVLLDGVQSFCGVSAALPTLSLKQVSAERNGGDNQKRKNKFHGYVLRGSFCRGRFCYRRSVLHDSRLRGKTVHEHWSWRFKGFALLGGD
jgi:hypothetical protein